ncbi:riboflavin synthase [Ameyamaea chiangmaiensis]|uniref:Riboflavin synthase n=1 Tax=Ameyamaea chiangmaiensis TaxID=442969 RepID=A0A850PIJ9_9PROT|nr:riboflavin synthase [Ameyamaea chiangmaiensis]MBS4073868.1 riboflavin synthase [Ameyamaea chiangmaiensis]NVN41632.1 riboflavin synthase [Ameyamaea chiangmaiensis]
MFSGIIETLGVVRGIVDQDRQRRIRVATRLMDLSMGESIAVNGVCLTVTSFDAEGDADFFISAETLARTSLGALREGSRVNLERAVTLATRLSGHIVQGHVDGTATLLGQDEQGEAHCLTFAVPDRIGRYLVEKGSIALDGISLTLNSVHDHDGQTRFGVTIIPHTWTHTTLGTTGVGAILNVEIDMIAKYVERLCAR